MINKHEQAASHLFCLCTPEQLPGPCKLFPGWCSLEDPAEGSIPGFGAVGGVRNGSSAIAVHNSTEALHHAQTRAIFSKRSNLCE